MVMAPVSGSMVVWSSTPSTLSPTAKGVLMGLKLAVSTPACCSQRAVTCTTTLLMSWTSVGVGGGLVTGSAKASVILTPCTLYQDRTMRSVRGLMLTTLAMSASALTLYRTWVSSTCTDTRNGGLRPVVSRV